MKIGDYVVIKKPGEMYSSYESWAHTVGATKWRSDRVCERLDKVVKDKIGIINALRPHDNHPQRMLALVDIGNREIIIGVTGLKVVGKSKLKGLELVVQSVISELRGNRQ